MFGFLRGSQRIILIAFLLDFFLYTCPVIVYSTVILFNGHLFNPKLCFSFNLNLCLESLNVRIHLLKSAILFSREIKHGWNNQYNHKKCPRTFILEASPTWNQLTTYIWCSLVCFVFSFPNSAVSIQAYSRTTFC